MNSENKKIFILPLPATGHVNPMTGLVTELVNKKKYKVYFYGNEEQRKTIENTGAEFRRYSYIPSKIFRTSALNINRNSDVSELFIKLLKCSFKQVPELLEHVENDKPDLIIYDHMSLSAKLLIEVLNKNFKIGKSKLPSPPHINFISSFAMVRNVYPADQEMKHLSDGGFWSFLSIIWLFMLQFIFSFKFGINVYNTFKLIFEHQEPLNIVSIFPELQPKSEKFDKTFKFVGSCISEKARKNQINDSRLKDLLESYKAVNPLNSIENRSENKLIYASLGTVFNNNLFIFDHIIEAFKLLNQKNDIKLVIALGKDNLKYYEEKIKKEDYKLPEYILLLETAPQIELLERSNLFITHCGMNSASETIHYGVPVICLPIKADQPLVAKRLADDLNIGIKYDPLSLTPDVLKNGIDKVLNETFYLENVIKLSKISRLYNGNLNSAEIVINYLNGL